MIIAYQHAAPLEREGEAVPAGRSGEIIFHFDRAFTLDEIAEKLGISPRQVQAHIDDGSLVAVNVGRGKERKNLRVLDEDLEGFVRRRKTGAVPTSKIKQPKSLDPPPAPPSTFAARRAAMLADRINR